MSQFSTNGQLALWDWFSRHGGSAPKARLSDTHARTFIASETVKGTQDGGDILFSIPISCLLESAAALADVTFGSVFEMFTAHQGVDDRTILVFFLAIERQKGMASHWAPYIRELPTEFPNLLNWSRAEIVRLSGTRLGSATTLQESALLKLVEVWVPVFIAILRTQLITSEAEKATASQSLALAQNALSPDRLAWSYSCVLSRAFSCFLNGKRTVALVPLGDMLDHSPDAQIEWRTDELAGQFSIISHECLPVGTVMFNNYGAKSNEELILGYGFSVKSKVLETLYVRVAVEDNIEMRCREYYRNHINSALDDIFPSLKFVPGHYLSTTSPVPVALLASSRMLMMSPAELYTWRCRKCGGSERQLKRDEHCIQYDRVSFRTLQQLVKLIREISERISQYKRLDPKYQSHVAGNVHCHVARTTKEYRSSQLEIANFAIGSLRLHCCQLVHKYIAVKGASAGEEVGNFKTSKCDPGCAQEIISAYDAWECHFGVEKISASTFSLVCHGMSQIQYGLRVSVPIAHGDIIGRVPVRALLVASPALRERCAKIESAEHDEVALAITVVLCAMNESNAYSPFAKWLLYQQTVDATLEDELLDDILDVASGHGATCFRRVYYDELNSLKSAGLQLCGFDECNLDHLYARARLMVSRQALRLPRAANILEPSISGHLSLVPFIGSFPHVFHFSIGTFRWVYRRHRQSLPEECQGMSSWHLELLSSCNFGVDNCLVMPFEEYRRESLVSVSSDFASNVLLHKPLNATTLQNNSSVAHPNFILVELLRSWQTQELCFQPADGDRQLRHRKENLLHVAGLGNIHHVTLYPSPARLFAAVGICAADRGTIFHENEMCLKSCAERMIFGSLSLNPAKSNMASDNQQSACVHSPKQHGRDLLTANTPHSDNASSDDPVTKEESKLVFSTKLLINLSHKNILKTLTNFLRRTLLCPNSEDLHTTRRWSLSLQAIETHIFRHAHPDHRRVLECWLQDLV